MAFEFPATGGVFPYQKIDAVNLLKYTTKPDYFLWATEIVFCIYILYYIIEERWIVVCLDKTFYWSLENYVDCYIIVNWFESYN